MVGWVGGWVVDLGWDGAGMFDWNWNRLRWCGDVDVGVGRGGEVVGGVGDAPWAGLGREHP